MKREYNHTELELYLNGEKFLCFLQTLDKQDRATAVGLTIDYFYVHGGLWRMDEFCSHLKNSGMSTPLLQTHRHFVLESCTERLHNNSDEVINKYLLDSVNDGYVYHAFNQNFESEIRTHGLSSQRRLWDEDDVLKIRRLLGSLGSRLAALAGYMSHGSLYVSETADVMYTYGSRSPEWFAELTNWGGCVNSDAMGFAFERRDYEEAYKNMQFLCRDLASPLATKSSFGHRTARLEKQDEDFIMRFFAESWETFASTENIPKLAVISRSACGLSSYPEETSPMALRLKNNVPLKVNDLKATAIIKLPPYEAVYPN